LIAVRSAGARWISSIVTAAAAGDESAGIGDRGREERGVVEREVGPPGRLALRQRGLAALPGPQQADHRRVDERARQRGGRLPGEPPRRVVHLPIIRASRLLFGVRPFAYLNDVHLPSILAGMRPLVLALVLALSPSSAGAQDRAAPDPGRRTFEARCGRCHGADGAGSEMGPAILQRLKLRDEAQLRTLVRDGIPARGMPPNPMPAGELDALVRFLRSIERDPDPAAAPRTFRTAGGTTIEGVVLGEGFDDLQIRTADGRVRLLRRPARSADGAPVREVTSETGWPAYNGDPRGNRYTTLTEISRGNVARLAPRWMFTLPNTGGLQVTPVVADGLMYVTAVNEVYALDAGSGREVWHFQRARTPGAAAWAQPRRRRRGRRVFFETDDARRAGAEPVERRARWDAPLADVKDTTSPRRRRSWPATRDRRRPPAASTAPRIRRRARSGTPAGQCGGSGRCRSRASPDPTTWKGTSPPDHRGAARGSPAATIRISISSTGRSETRSREYNGDDRDGDNLYANSLVALERKTGRLRGTTSSRRTISGTGTATQDVGDRRRRLAGAAAQAAAAREPQRASSTVFDRADGALLLAKPFVPQSHVGERHRRRRPTRSASRDRNRRPAARRCVPSQDGATNWFSPSFNPADRPAVPADVREMQHLHEGRRWRRLGAGKQYLGGSQRTAPDPRRRRVLKAIDEPHRRRHVGAAAAGARRCPGAARWRRRPGSSSSARRAARSWPPTRTMARRSGASRPTPAGRRRR
jgi:alcohol dehydrogenase (cytochrome c)